MDNDHHDTDRYLVYLSCGKPAGKTGAEVPSENKENPEQGADPLGGTGRLEHTDHGEGVMIVDIDETNLQRIKERAIRYKHQNNPQIRMSGHFIQEILTRLELWDIESEEEDGQRIFE